MYINNMTVYNDDITAQKLLTIIRAAVEDAGLNGHNIKGYNDFLDVGINRIMTEHFNIEKRIQKNRDDITPEDRLIDSYKLEFKFNSIDVGRPIQPLYATGTHSDMYPGMARIANKSYNAAITMAANVIVYAYFKDGHTETKEAAIPSFKIGEIPIMVKSSHCHLASMSREGIKALGEDPTDEGGYFVTSGNEYIADPLENIRYNHPHIHIAIKANEKVRLEYLSQPGGAFENSAQIKVRLMTNGQITIELNSTRFEKVRIPFFLIYRLFGMTSDRDIIETIVSNVEDGQPLTVMLLEILENAIHNVDDNYIPFNYEINRERLAEMTAEMFANYQTGNVSDENVVRHLNEELLGSPSRPGGLDKIFLPHMGQTTDDRLKKLRFLGILIKDLLLVNLGVLPPTDRDNYKNKRIHSAGVSIAKAFKTQVNNVIISPSIRAIKRMLTSDQWRDISSASLQTTFRNSFNTADLEKIMNQVLTTNNKVIMVKQRASQNRVASQQLERKNKLNVFSSLRNITSQSSSNSSKQTERANQQRQVHPSYSSIICNAQSADTGESVGMKKQLAITATICGSSDVLPLKLKLATDELVTKLIDLPIRNLQADKYANIFVNGVWIGATTKPFDLIGKYRQYRRSGEIDRYVTIYYEIITNKVEFLLDVGRVRRPVLIVYNNIEEFDDYCREHFKWSKNKVGPEPVEVKFTQNIKLTMAHINKLLSKEIALSHLIEMEIMEHITAEEQENCLFAENIITLRNNRHNYTYQYTHCEIEQSIFGLAAHVSPYGNHTQPARVCYETNQGRQTAGWYALNFPFRVDKIRFLQFYNQVPLVRTITHDLIPANGSNVIIAYMIYGGDNQEDSAILSKAAAERGLFDGIFFKFEDAHLEKSEIFTKPDPATTKNMKQNANYSLLNANGEIQKNIIVRSGDVLIGRVVVLKKSDTTDNYTQSDKSVIYRGVEPAFVEDVYVPRGADDHKFITVKLRFERPLRIGDKLSSRSGNKSIVAKMLNQCDMPYTEDGIIPDIIINPHSFPTRMIIGQTIETFNSIVCARNGSFRDGTAFLPIDHNETCKELLELGYRSNGLRRMYNGMTGEYFDAAIFMGPTAEQRLQKFVLDDEQAVAGSGPTDATTGQPLGGKHVQGGLRLGEMEKWALQTHGSMFNLYEKSSIDSDGRRVYICRQCSQVAVCNTFANIYECKTCGEYADIAVVESTKTAALMRAELAGANIKLKTELRPREFMA